MSTTTRRAPRAHKASALPFSATAAKLIEQIQADARAQLLADLSAKDAVIVLHGFDAETKRVLALADSIDIEDGLGNKTHYSRRREEPESWRGAWHMRGQWHPSHWACHKTLVDASGNAWINYSSPPLVCNDFGDLVEVAE